jgi:O-antigen/teichoic acid export membrane protein
MTDLKGRAIRGGFAKMWAQGAIFVLRLGSMMILARLLDPKEFGLVAMVTVVTGIFDLFRDAGLSTATIQRATIREEQVSTLFWINAGVGTLLAALTAASAPILAAFYREPRLLWITVALASGFIINALGVQHGALLQRRLRFTAVAMVDVLRTAGSVAVGIGMALSGFGYWSLVGMSLVSPIIATASAWILVPWVPGRPRRGIGARSMLKFGGTVTVDGLVTYIGYNAEKVLLGRFFGTDALGIYGRAYQLVNIPTQNLSSSVSGVAFSALSRVQNDAARFRSYFLKGYSLILMMTLPITMACVLFADDFVMVVLGPKWTGTIPLLRLLAPTIVAFSLINPFGWLLTAIGRVMRSLKIGLVIMPLVIGAYIVGLPHGPRGVALGYSAMMVLLTVPVIAWSKIDTPITTRDIWRAVRPPLLSGLAASAGALGLHGLIFQALAPLLRLILELGAMIAVYLGMLLFVMGQKGFYFDLLRHILKRPPAGDGTGEGREEIAAGELDLFGQTRP